MVFQIFLIICPFKFNIPGFNVVICKFYTVQGEKKNFVRGKTFRDKFYIFDLMKIHKSIIYFLIND